MRVKRGIIGPMIAAMLTSAGCGSDEEPAPIDAGLVPNGVSVEGRLVDGHGQRLPFVSVWIPGHRPTASDGLGRFRVDGVTPPYDLFAIAIDEHGAEGDELRILGYEQVTRLDPVLSVPWKFQESHHAGVSGYVNFVDYSDDGDVVMGFGSPDPNDFYYNANGGGSYSASVYWYGPASTTGSLFALHYDTRERRFLGFGRADGLVMRPGDDLSGPPLYLSPTKTAHIEGTVAAAPPGFTLESLRARVRIGTAWLELEDVRPKVGPFSFPVPEIAGASFRIGIQAGDGQRKIEVSRTLASPSAGVTLALPSPPELVAPADGAIDVSSSSRFVWTGEGPGISWVDVHLAEAKVRVQIVTNRTSTSLPDLEALGLSLPRGATMAWSVSRCTPVASVDELLDGEPEPHPKCEGTARSLTQQARTAP